MSNKDFRKLSIMIVGVMIIRSFPYIVNIDDSLFIGIFDSVVLAANLLVLVLIAIQAKSAQEQIAMMKQNEIVEKTANLKLKTRFDYKDYLEFELHNIGKGVAYNLTVNAYKGKTNTKLKIYYEDKSEKDGDVYLNNINNEFVYFHEHINFKIGGVANIRKVRIEVAYQDDSSKEVNFYEETIERKIKNAKKS